MRGVAADPLDGDDVRAVATSVRCLLQAGGDEDWSVRAGELDWTVREVVAHLCDVAGFYGIHLALQSRRRLRFDTTLHPAATSSEALDTLQGLAEFLARTIDDAPPGARGWHHQGLADADGFAAMACDELLVHGADIAAGLQRPFEAEGARCRRVAGRLFPWVPDDVDPWEALLWANGRAALPGHPRLPAEWAWVSAPLAEWDGQRAARREPPAAYVWDAHRTRWVPAG